MIACMAMVCINLLILQHEGEWKDGKRDGNGSMKYTTGKVYAGEWKDNRRNGKGVCKFVNGHVYEGEWRNDCMNGNGIYIFADIAVYTREWKDGERNGKCLIKFKQKEDVYNGEFRDDKRNGHGIYKNDDGVYEGEWKDNERDGPGIFTDVNGVMFKHVYDQGFLVSRPERCISSEYIKTISCSPPHQPTDAVGVILLNDRDTECQLCLDEFLIDMDSEDAAAKMRLPVIGVCGHVCCYGCVLKQQTVRAKVNGGRVPKRINCMECRKVAAFNPDAPKYDRRLID